MYAGGHGLTRNIQVAVEYFRLAADQNDAQALLMYGLVLIKVNIQLFIHINKINFQGHGIKKNITEGVRHIEDAVKHGYHDAKNALGYHAYNIEKNYTKAAKYWQQCYDQNNNIFCAYNLVSVFFFR